ncbi:MAG: hypothetical protein ACK4YM_00080 [Novosphingobium sp.]
MLPRGDAVPRGRAGVWRGQDDGHSHDRACLNSGPALIGSHCHACGQAAHVSRTLGAFFVDLLPGGHFAGTIWRTLPLLLAHSLFHLRRQLCETQDPTRIGAWRRTWLPYACAKLAPGLFTIGVALYAAAG